jgi:hypothetical protein
VTLFLSLWTYLILSFYLCFCVWLLHFYVPLSVMFSMLLTYSISIRYSVCMLSYFSSLCLSMSLFLSPFSIFFSFSLSIRQSVFTIKFKFAIDVS